MAQINHVSVNALNLDESVRFYEDLLGVERIPTPNFVGIPVQWLALGRTQLHLFDATSSRRAITTWGSRLMTSSPSTGRLSGGTPSITGRSATTSSSCPETSSSSTSATRRATLWKSTTTASTDCPTTFALSSRACGTSTRRARRTCAAGSSCPSTITRHSWTPGTCCSTCPATGEEENHGASADQLVKYCPTSSLDCSGSRRCSCSGSRRCSCSGLRRCSCSC